MRPIYKSLALTAMTLQVSLALNAQTYDGETTSETALPAEVLDSLRVELIAPNVSGARDSIKSGECTIDGSNLAITLNAANWVKGATYRVQVLATFGTQTQVIYALDVTVPYYVALSDTPQEYEDTVTVVSTVGGAGGGGGADATVYALNGDGNAHITKPLNVSGSVSEGAPYYTQIFPLNVVVLTPEQKAEVEAETGIAYDYCDANSIVPFAFNAITIYANEECTQKVGSTSKTKLASITGLVGLFFNLQDGESIEAGAYYARAERGVLGDYSHAEGVSTTASGSASHAEGGTTTASGLTSHAEGGATTASGSASHAEGYGTTASGNHSHAEGGGTDASGNYSHAEGGGTNASGNRSHAEGEVTTASGAASHAEGYGTTASGNHSHAEGDSATASGNYSHAEGYGTNASGNRSHAEGSYTVAKGDNSHAEGEGTIAAQDNQHVCGQFNVEDTDDDYQFIVGNGADDEHRSNAFAVTKSGELALFEADGTPVILTAANLKALIASLQ